MSWSPWLGAVPDARGTRFRVWAPRARALKVRIEGGSTAELVPDAKGYFAAEVEGVRPGARYLYRFPDGRERPDPASLLQPEGVHGASEVVALPAIAPRRPAPEVPLDKLVISELHFGTFTPEGTADAAARRLPALAEAHFTAVEAMPIAAFPGARNWGYDGVFPFAAHAAYGGPAALARFVDAAHAAGLRALLDVVYNHLGPEGNYLREFGPYFTERHKTPWGDALNFDGADSGPVRRYFIENALRWVSSAGGGFDGLRLDAVHGIVDESATHFLEELAAAVAAEARATGRTIHLIAESDQNEPKLVERYRLDAVWADELHHGLHVALTGESSGYYQDFAPPHLDPLQAMIAALRAGWHYGGVYKPFFRRVHGQPAGHLPGRRFVVAAQNHDQIGNRARGERLVSLTSRGGARIATALLALQPSIPLFFQGEEWGAEEPFLYFVSHGDPALVEAVRKGRREEFKDFAWAGEVPDPQDEATFRRSRLDWEKRETPEARAALAWHRALFGLRREHPALQDDARNTVSARAQGRVLLLQRTGGGRALLLVCALDEGPARAELPGPARILLDSAEERFTPAHDARLARLERNTLHLCGRQAVVLEAV